MSESQYEAELKTYELALKEAENKRDRDLISQLVNDIKMFKRGGELKQNQIFEAVQDYFGGFKKITTSKKLIEFIKKEM